MIRKGSRAAFRASSEGVRWSIKGSTGEYREARGLSKGANEAEHKGAESGSIAPLLLQLTTSVPEGN